MKTQDFNLMRKPATLLDYQFTSKRARLGEKINSQNADAVLNSKTSNFAPKSGAVLGK
jgi:hypothetical protein